jgi:hypothetical protein
MINSIIQCKKCYNQIENKSHLLHVGDDSASLLVEVSIFYFILALCK